jgi:hypothetical protein
LAELVPGERVAQAQLARYAAADTPAPMTAPTTIPGAISGAAITRRTSCIASRASIVSFGWAVIQWLSCWIGPRPPIALLRPPSAFARSPRRGLRPDGQAGFEADFVALLEEPPPSPQSSPRPKVVFRKGQVWLRQ